jgi:glutamate synthase (NADPH/NADH) large chain
MKRIGAKSCSGEGGEVRERYQPTPEGDNPNSAIKQVASGRFGVTAEYLNQCRELEIKGRRAPSPARADSCPASRSPR